MKKICIQAGHRNVMSGATGAPGERDWNAKVVDLLADKLNKEFKDLKGFEVYKCDGFANNDKKVTETDWDLFLAVHYDSDTYNDTGGFVDIPDASVDKAHKESKRIADIISNIYFNKTKIKNVPRRSNANTKFYYIWSSLSAKTPCVIIECGVGWRKPEDYNTLRNFDLIVNTLFEGITTALGLEVSKPIKPSKPEDNCDKCNKELEEMRESRNKWKSEASELQKRVKDLEKQLDECNTKCGIKDAKIANFEAINTQLNNKLEKLKLSLEELKKDLDLLVD